MPAFLGARTCAISFKHAQYFGCTTRPSSGLKFQLHSVGTQKSPHGLYVAAQDAVQILKGRREARKPTSIYLPHFFLAILYPFGWDQVFFCVLLTAACNLLKNWGFSAQVCISAFGLSAGAIALFSVLLRLSFVFLLHTVSLVFMSLYWYAYSFELLLVFTPLCKHAERINIRFQPLVSLWCSHNTRSLRLTPLQWLQCERDSQRGKLWDLCLLECKWLYHLIQQQLPILTTLKP